MQPIKFIKNIFSSCFNTLFCRTRSDEFNTDLVDVDPDVERAERIGVARAENPGHDTIIVDATPVNPTQIYFLPTNQLHFTIQGPLQPTPSVPEPDNDVHAMQPSDVVRKSDANLDDIDTLHTSVILLYTHQVPCE